MNYRSRWQQKRRERLTRQRLIVILVCFAALVALIVSVRGCGVPSSSGFQSAGRDVSWITAGDGFLLVCGRSGRLARIPPDLSGSAGRWPRDFTNPAGFLGPAALVRDLAVVGCADVRVRAVDVATGQQAWEIAAGGPVSSVTTYGGRVYFGSEDGWLYAATAEGSVMWRAQMGGKVVAAPLVTQDTVIAATLAGKVIAVSRATGKRLWLAVTGASIYAAPRLGSGMVLVGDDAGVLHALSPAGETVGSTQLAGLIRAPVAVAEDVIVVGDSSGLLVRVNPSDMTEVWRAHLRGPIVCAPIILGDRVWCGAGPTLVAVNVATGRAARRLRGDADTSDLLAAFHRIYWASADGRVRSVSSN